MVAGKEVDGWWDLDYATISPSPGRLNTKRMSRDTEQTDGLKTLTKELVEAVLDKLVIICHLVDHNSKASHTTLHYLQQQQQQGGHTHCQIIFIKQQVTSKMENIFSAPSQHGSFYVLAIYQRGIVKYEMCSNHLQQQQLYSAVSFSNMVS